MFSNLLPAKENFAVRVFLPALIPTSVSDHVLAVEFAKWWSFHSQTTMTAPPNNCTKGLYRQGKVTRSTRNLGVGNTLRSANSIVVHKRQLTICIQSL